MNFMTTYVIIKKMHGIKEIEYVNNSLIMISRGTLDCYNSNSGHVCYLICPSQSPLKLIFDMNVFLFKMFCTLFTLFHFSSDSTFMFTMIYTFILPSGICIVCCSNAQCTVIYIKFLKL